MINILRSPGLTWAASVTVILFSLALGSAIRSSARGAEARARAAAQAVAEAKKEIADAQRIIKTSRLDADLATVLTEIFTPRSPSLRLTGITATLADGAGLDVLATRWLVPADEPDETLKNTVEAIRLAAAERGITLGRFSMKKEETAAGARRVVEELCVR